MYWKRQPCKNYSIHDYRALEGVDNNGMIQFYTEACNIYEQEGKMRSGIDVYKRAIVAMIKCQRSIFLVLTL